MSLSYLEAIQIKDNIKRVTENINRPIRNVAKSPLNIARDSVADRVPAV